MNCAGNANNRSGNKGKPRMTKPKKEPIEPLRRWLDDRMSRGDISYVHRVDGIDVYRAIRNPYPEQEENQE